MVLKEIHNVYLIGIGGIGMSALARYFLTKNKHVAGYDKTPSEITYGLSQLGASIHFEDDVKKIDKIFLDKKSTLVIYTPAVPKDLRELTFFQELGFKVYKRSEILGLITEKSYCFAVAGTHGKTTTTSILAHLLYECNIPFTAFLGGISENYNTNFILRGSEVTVVEADEFDRSFLSLKPDMACITSMDADHLDVYGEAEVLRDSFKAFALCLKPNGKLFVRNGLPLKGITYGIEDDSDYSIINIKIENGTYVFDVKTSKTVLERLRFNLPGRHNLSNALIALAMAVEYGCPPRQLVKALASFKGVKRRFTYHINTEDFILIDDYAHHPEEINAVYQAVREMYPKKKVLAIFQPHLYSRTRDFANDFARSLAQFDALLLLDIYPAREVPINGITSAWLLDKIGLANKQLVDKNELIDKIHESSAQIVITMGAGDISDEVKLIKKEFSIAS
ncbi:UDP-N-acetylmuramate--L-alanine ligase [Aestuariivivens sediminicola]|uniref:UDP-N-acetylmuramate--L-alanine ligase n=1 Tax=Aestuariivivens sediminicola TaxID=2913560 RepID=UPI001F59E3A9|nr:UDP-N-acetylmuramate--L-alanine ligase [Aestuariivivens sediminicola]